MFRYKRRVNYYETDQMAIVHNSNYLRYFEEGRIQWLDQIGFPYRWFEENKIISPVLEINCQYIKPLRFDDEFELVVKLITCTPVKFEVTYEIYLNDEIVTKGYSKHCYLDENGKILSIKRAKPDVYEKLLTYLDD